MLKIEIVVSVSNLIFFLLETEFTEVEIILDFCPYLMSPRMIRLICNSPLIADRDPTRKNPKSNGMVKTMTTDMRFAGFEVPSNMYL